MYFMSLFGDFIQRLNIKMYGGKVKKTFNRLHYMNDHKIFTKYDTDLKGFLNRVKCLSFDIGMDFGELNVQKYHSRKG